MRVMRPTVNPTALTQEHRKKLIFEVSAILCLLLLKPVVVALIPREGERAGYYFFGDQVASRVHEAFSPLILVLFVMWASQEGMSHFQIRRPDWYSDSTAIVALVGIASAAFVASPATGVDITLPRPLFLTIGLVFLACLLSATHLVVIQAYLITRLRDLSNSLPLAVTLASFCFGISFVDWGWGSALIASILALLISVLFVVRQTVWPQIACLATLLTLWAVRTGQL